MCPQRSLWTNRSLQWQAHLDEEEGICHLEIYLVPHTEVRPSLSVPPHGAIPTSPKYMLRGLIHHPHERHLGVSTFGFYKYPQCLCQHPGFDSRVGAYLVP